MLALVQYSMRHTGGLELSGRRLLSFLLLFYLSFLVDFRGSSPQGSPHHGDVQQTRRAIVACKKVSIVTITHPIQE